MTSQIWDAWNLEGGPRYPHNKLVQFCFRNFSPEQRRETRVLDLGCGSGANTAFLVENGFAVTATDISAIAVEATRSRLSAINREADLRVESAGQISGDNSSFDLVLCFGVLEAVGLSESKKIIAEVHRVLAPSGQAFFLFAASGDFRVVPGNPLALTGKKRRQVTDIFDVFPFLELDSYRSTYFGERVRQRDWMVRVGKERLNGPV